MELINVKPEDLYSIIDKAIQTALNKQNEKSSSALLTREATAKRLGVDLSTLWRWDKSGYLKPIRIGRTIYYKVSDLEARERGEITL